MSRNRINWNSDPLLDELTRQPRDEDLLGVDWGDVGRKTLGGSHMAGKVLLSAFGGGALVEPVERLQAKGGVLPEWATKTLRVNAPDFVVVSKDIPPPIKLGGIKSVLVFGGTRTDGAYDRKQPFGATFSIAVDGPSRVEIEQKNGQKTAYTDAKMVVFLGGVAEGNLDVAGEEVMGLDLTDLEAELLGLEPVSVEEMLAQAETAPPPPSMSYAAAPTAELRQARARADKYKARLAAAQARQALMPTSPGPISPMEVPSFDLSQFMTRSSDMDAKDLDDVLGADRVRNPEEAQMVGEKLRAGRPVILGSDAGREYEILGHDGEIDRTDLSDLAAEVLGDVGGDTEIIGSNDWVEIVGDDYQFGCDVLGAPLGAVASQVPVSATGAPRRVVATQGKLLAAPARSTAVAPKAPVSRANIAAKAGAAKKVFKVAQPSKKLSPHKASIARAERVKGRVQRAGSQLNNKLKQIKLKVAGPTRVRGYEDEILGAALPPRIVKVPPQAHRVPTTPRQKAAAGRLKGVQEKLASAVTKSLKKGDKALASAIKLDASIKKAKPAVAKMFEKKQGMPFSRGGTKVRGDDVLGLPFVTETAVDEMLDTMVHDDFDVSGAETYDTAAEARRRLMLRRAAASVPRPSRRVAPAGRASSYNLPVWVLGDEDELGAETYDSAAEARRRLMLRRAAASMPRPSRRAAPAGRASSYNLPVWVLGLDPGDPNYDPRFDDPNYTGDYGSPVPGDTGALAPSSPTYFDPLADPLAAPVSAGSWEDYYEGDIPLPVRGQSLSKDEAAVIWNNAPADAVIYDGVARGFPADTFGSWNIFYGQSEPLPKGGAYPDGYTYGAVGGDPAAWVVRDKAGIVRADVGEGQVNNMSFYERPTENMKKFWPSPASIGSTQAAARNSSSSGWGPLIGSNQLHGLQYAVNEDRWFWQPSIAPRWYPAVNEADKEIERLNKEAREAAKDAWEADQARARIEAAERERMTAQQNFDTEMAVNKAELESAITADKLNQQQAIADQQAVAMQTALDMQTQRAELEFMTQQAGLEQRQEAMMQQAMQADLDYAIAHPEIAQQAAEEGYPAEEGYGYPEEGYPQGLEEGGYSLDEGYPELAQELMEEGRAEDYYEDEAAALAMDME